MSKHTNQTHPSSPPSRGLSTQHSFGPWQVFVESNLLNVLVLVLAIVYVGNKFLPKIADERKKQISKELEEAKLARIKAEEELEEIQKKTKNIFQEVESIKKEAKETALTIRKQIEQDTEKELEGLKAKIKKEINTSKEEAIQNIKRQTSESAIRFAEEALTKVSKNLEIQKKLASDFLNELKTPNKN